MKRRDFIKGGAAASLLSLLPRTGLFAETTASRQRPNVLFLFSDQHNADIASYAGNPDVPTPNLDALAAGGTRFNRAYCQNGVCLPSRNSLFTGQYSRTFGLLRNEDVDHLLQPYLLERMVPMQRTFHDAGYYTFTTGKRHLYPILDTGWDYSAGDLWHKTTWNLEQYDTLNYWAWLKQQGWYDQGANDFGPEFPGMQKEPRRPMGCGITKLPANGTMEAFAAQQTIDFLKSDTAKKQPFFAWSTFYRPHQPWTPLQEYVDQIDMWKLRLPATLWQNPDELPPGLRGARVDKRRVDSLGWANEEMYRLYIAYYLATVLEIDVHIGNILKALEQQGLAENTIVIYSSDHGSFVGGHGLNEKWPNAHNFYEDTLRVPLMFRWPGKIQSGSVRQDLVELIDVYPTLTSICGVPMPSWYSTPGRDLSQTLLQGTPVGRKYAISENMIQATVITDDLKYGQWLNTPKPQKAMMAYGDMLMDRTQDPDEIHNLIHDSANAGRLAEMQGHLKEWANNTDDAGRRGIFSMLKAEYSVL